MTGAACALFGCSRAYVATPYTAAAGTFGDAATKSAPALATLPVVLAQSCWKSGNTAYLQARLDRLNAEAKGIGLPASSAAFLTFAQWREKGPAVSGASWTTYCGDLQRSGAAFTDGVAALTRYGNALEALAKTGGYDGSGLMNLTNNLGKLRDALAASTTDSSKAVAPLADVVGKLGALIESRVVEADLRSYISEADPKIGALIDALVRYVEAVDREFDVLESRTGQVLGALEILTGFGTVRDPVPACATVQLMRPSDRGASPEKAPEAPGANRLLVDVCDTLRFLSRRLDGTIALSFYQFALSTSDDLRDARAALSGYKDLLLRLKSVHKNLLAAGQFDTSAELKGLAGELSDLGAKIGAFGATLAARK
jgi:hypothetical protein